MILMFIYRYWSQRVFISHSLSLRKKYSLVNFTQSIQVIIVLDIYKSMLIVMICDVASFQGLRNEYSGIYLIFYSVRIAFDWVHYTGTYYHLRAYRSTVAEWLDCHTELGSYKLLSGIWIVLAKSIIVKVF